MKHILAKKFPVTYDSKEYYVKIYKYDYHKDQCRTAIYKKFGFLYFKLNDECCAYSEDYRSSDYIFFTCETIKRYLARKDYEKENRIEFEENFHGECDKVKRFIGGEWHKYMDE